MVLVVNMNYLDLKNGFLKAKIKMDCLKLFGCFWLSTIRLILMIFYIPCFIVCSTYVSVKIHSIPFHTLPMYCFSNSIVHI